MSFQTRCLSLRRFVVIAAFATLSPFAAAQGAASASWTIDQLVTKFDELYKTNKPNFETQLREDAFQHATFYYRGQALAAMYEATGNVAHVKELDELVQVALKYRDDKIDLPREDTLRDAPSRAWRKLNGPLNRKFASVGDAAMVTAPMAHLYWILSKDPTLLPHVVSRPEALYGSILETIEDLDRDLNDAPSPLDRHYLYTPTPAVDNVICETQACHDEKAKANKAMAYNVQFLMGLTLVYLNNVQQSSVLHRRIAGITRHFFEPGNVVDKMLPDGSVATWFNRADWSKQPEDPGHLNYAIDFFKSAADYEARVPDFARAAPLMPSHDFPARLARAASGLAARVAPYWATPPAQAPEGYKYVCGTLPIGSVPGMPIFHVYLDGSRPDCMPERLLRGCQEMMVMTVADPALGAVCNSLMERPSGASVTSVAYRLRALTNR